MEYGKIIAVTGLPGLFELVSSKSNGAIVRSLEDQSTRFVASRVHNFSHLESIEVYTVRDNINLVEVFIAMSNSNEPFPDVKDVNALKSYFQKVYPDLDFERVYSSDLKKMVKWFGILKSNNIELKSYDEAEAAEAAEATPVVEEVAEKTEEAPKKAAKKTAARKTAAKEEGEEKPAAPKKAAKKKATAEKTEESAAPKKAAKKSASKKSDSK